MLKNVLFILMLLLCSQSCGDMLIGERPSLTNFKYLEELKTISNQQLEVLVREYLRDTLRNAHVQVDLTREMLWVDTFIDVLPEYSLKYIISDNTTDDQLLNLEGYTRSTSLSSKKIQVYEHTDVEIWERNTVSLQTFRPASDTTRLAVWIDFSSERKYYLFIRNGDNWDFAMSAQNYSSLNLHLENGYIQEVHSGRDFGEMILDDYEYKKFTFSPDFRSLEVMEKE
jgi:hypothetical protein